MDQTVVGLFDTFNQAQTAVQQLVDDGFARDQMSLIANDANGEYAKYTTTGDKVKNAAGAGAVGGTVVGGIAGLLVGLGALTIPGIGSGFGGGSAAGRDSRWRWYWRGHGQPPEWIGRRWRTECGCAILRRRRPSGWYARDCSYQRRQSTARLGHPGQQ